MNRIFQFCILWAALGIASAASPVVFYTDLDSGPNTGGENGLGAYVTIYGNYFGAQQGNSTVTVGGRAVAGYKAWSSRKIVVQLGRAAETGAVIVTVGDVASNDNVRFTVRPGKIYFVADRGSDSGRGTFSKPYVTLKKCKDAMAAGDICYAMDGVTQTNDAYNAALSIQSSGAPGRPKAIVAYPGATVTVARPGFLAIRTPAIGGGPFEYWTIAGLHLTGTVALEVRGRGWRIVGNELQCPTGDGASGCLETSEALHIKVLGNEIHHAGCGEKPGLEPCAWIKAKTTIGTSGTAMTASGFTSGFSVPDRILVNGQQRKVVSCGSSNTCTIDAPFVPDIPAGTTWEFRDFAPHKMYHSMYFSSDSADVEAAWNHIHDNLSCRGIQFHSSPRQSVKIVSTSGTPVIVTTAGKLGLVAGQRIWIAGSSDVNGAFFAVPRDLTHIELYSDKALTQPVASPHPGSGGTVQDGLNQYDLSVHDNVIHGQTCDGINFATVDPSIGPVQAYNNVVYETGSGTTDGGTKVYPPVGGESHYAAIYNAGYANRGPAGSGTIQVYNNTLFDNGSKGGPDAGAIASSGSVTLNLVNNIICQNSRESYITRSTAIRTLAGSNNVWCGAGVAPSGFTKSISADPLFVNLGARDFHLKPGSPALGTGIRIPGLATDLEGAPRTSPPSIGACN